jgi:hypothetical protein
MGHVSIVPSNEKQEEMALCQNPKRNNATLPKITKKTVLTLCTLDSGE